MNQESVNNFKVFMRDFYIQSLLLGQTLILFGLSEHYFCRFIGVNGPSMLPTIDSRDTLLYIDNFTTKFIRNPRKGEIIIAQNPFKQMGNTVVKRVLYLENEYAEFYDVREQKFQKVLVPPNHIWVEGDNKQNSRDSRTYGPVSLNQVIGIARFKLWPFNQIGRLQ
eukprot:403350345